MIKIEALKYTNDSPQKTKPKRLLTIFTYLISERILLESISLHDIDTPQKKANFHSTSYVLFWAAFLDSH